MIEEVTDQVPLDPNCNHIACICGGCRICNCSCSASPINPKREPKPEPKK